jgi:hypothetical protein
MLTPVPKQNINQTSQAQPIFPLASPQSTPPPSRIVIAAATLAEPCEPLMDWVGFVICCPFDHDDICLTGKLSTELSVLAPELKIVRDGICIDTPDHSALTSNMTPTGEDPPNTTGVHRIWGTAKRTRSEAEW